MENELCGMPIARGKARGQAALHWLRVVFLLLLCAVPLQATLAQPNGQTVLLQPTDVSSTAAEAPVNSRDIQPMTVMGADPASLRPGDSFIVNLPTFAGASRDEQVFRIIDSSEMVNGDIVLQALSDSLANALTVTIGGDAFFGQLEYNGRLIQFRAHRDKGVPGWAGWFYNTSNLTGHTDRRDYVIPDRNRRHINAQPMSIEGGGSTGSLASNTVSGGNKEISQRFSVPNILVGEQENFNLTITVRNTAYSQRQLPSLDIYLFRLERTEILQLPSGCRWARDFYGDNFIRCSTGDAFRAGEVRTFTFHLRSDAEPAPDRLWSVAFLGDLEHQAFLNVVMDILGAPDLDGVSAFNASLAENTTRDPLGNVIIDVLVLYTAQAVSLYGNQTETRINQLFAVANQIYRASGVGITLRPVHHAHVNYPQAHDMETMLDNLTYGTHPALVDVPARRADYGADLVMLFTPLSADAAICGLANLGGFNTRGDFQSFDDSDYAFSVIGIDCPFSSVVAHEAGHNMGLTHSHAEDGQGGTFSFATGHAEHGLFATVMADPAYFGDAERVARFSNPDLDCFGRPCGVDHTDPHFGADAVRALNLVRYQIANYYPTRIPPLPSRQVARADGGSTGARIAMAATTDRGRSFATRISPADRVDVNAEFHIDENHSGRQAVYHVVLYVSGQFLQLTAGGRLLDWDGQHIEALEPFRAAPETLTAHSVLNILDQIQVPSDLVGRQLQIFVAYQLLEDTAEGLAPSGELIYTQEPLVLDVVSP